MKGFKIITPDHNTLRFRYYTDVAAETVKAFEQNLPIKKVFYHARLSGQEIWTDDAPELYIIQENASVFVEPGEVVIGPLKPIRVKTSKCLGIYYGEGRGLDACNIFAKVLKEDFHLLQELGQKIWKEGQQELSFQKIE